MSTDLPFSVWIEAEQWPAGEWTPDDDATDVVVTLHDGSRWVASFVAYRHVATLTSRNRESGECLGGKYLWASDLVLVDSTDRASVEAVVADLLQDGGFDTAFTPFDDTLGEDDGR